MEKFIRKENNFSVLIIDDCVDICEIMGRLLEQRGCKVHYAYNGKQGIEKALEIIPNLIFIDYHMPVMNGIDALREFKRNKLTNFIPVIMFTSCLEKQQLAQSIGCDFFIRKPITSDTVVEIVDRLKKSV